MITVIVCSKSPKMADQIKQSVEETIGIPFEILITNNAAEKKSITTVYNENIQKAKYSLLCFVHEDVLFKTTNWGLKVENHLKDIHTGLIGIAGGDALSMVPSTWSNVIQSPEINILQWRKQHASNPVLIKQSAFNFLKEASDVTALDGVFLCCRKELFNKIQFDEDLLTGFHGYDIDLSLQAGQYYKNKVVFDILLEHFSEGSLNREWMESCFLIAKKWKHRLPIYTNAINRKTATDYHWQTIHQLIRTLFTLRYKPTFIYFNCLLYSYTQFFSVRKFISMNKLFLTEYKRIKQQQSTNSHQIIHREPGLI